MADENGMNNWSAWEPLRSDLGNQFVPPPKLKLSEWAEQNIILSPEFAAHSSRLRLFGWQKEIFDAFTDPRVEEVVMWCSTQMIKTLFIQAAVAYVIAVDPGPILVLQPTDTDARDFSRERLTPMLRDCPVLHGRVSESMRDGTNRLQAKDFPGGNISLVGAQAPANLARRSIRYLFCDEVDKYPASVRSAASGVEEGDPMDLARERMVTFGSTKKLIRCCSPTVAGRSRIGKAYASSDRRKPWVPCPHCGEMQLLKFSQVKWNSGIARELQAATAHYECEKCHQPWAEHQRLEACERAEWRAEKPFGHIAGFWISHLYSPWKKLPQIVDQFLIAKNDRNQFRSFTNTTLAEEWQEYGEAPSYEALRGRAEDYRFGDDENAVVPSRALFLTAAVDVQDNQPRLEVEVVAWGRHRERWSMGYWVLQSFAQNGQPLPVTSPELWQKLDTEILQRTWRHESGHDMSIRVMCIDTGNRPKPVYDFALRHVRVGYGPQGLKLYATRTVVPTKGTDDSYRIISTVSKEDAARQRQGIRIVGIGTHCAKQEIYDLLHHVRPKPDGSLSGAPVPGCYHFPRYESVYFEGLTAEQRLVKDSGKVEWEKKQDRNEPLDLAVMNRAAAAIVGIDRMTEAQWAGLEAALGVLPAAVPPGTAAGQEFSTLPATKPATASNVIQPNVPRPATPAHYYPARTGVRGRFF